MASILGRNKNLNMPKKTMSDYAEDALYREVWEDVNNDKTQAFLKKYYRPLIAAAIIIMILATGFQMWRHNIRTNRIATAGAYEMAIGNMDANALTAMANNNSNATADLAMFQSYMLSGDVSALEKLAARGATRDFRDLAKIHLAANLGDAMTATEFEKFLGALDTKKSPYYYNAALMVAQKYLATGDKATADKWLNKIINDKEAPATISANAMMLK